ncbi:MAG: cytochrome b/b6 domain-containing protein [Terriglobales bacterium]
MPDGDNKPGPESQAPPLEAPLAESSQPAPKVPPTASPSAPSEQLAQREDATPVPSAEPVARKPAPTRPPELAVAAKANPDKAGAPYIRAAYEHPYAIRVTHWINAVCVFVLITSGLRIFRAFPSFGPKIPQHDFVDIPKAITLGGWLGGALQWHFTFMWLFAASGAVYLAYQFLSGHYRIVLFTPKDIPGVWPMVRHYFLFGPKPPVTGQYNPLQKLAYTSTVGFGVLSLLTGLVMYKPVQFSWLAFLFGGFHLTRIWHFTSMCGFVAFIPGHLIMVALHGWSNFYSMLSGWKREPEYQD